MWQLGCSSRGGNKNISFKASSSSFRKEDESGGIVILSSKFPKKMSKGTMADTEIKVKALVCK